MQEINYVGNLRGDKPQGYSGSVYKTDGIAPAILSRDYKDPSLIIELGYMDNGTGKHQSNTVLSIDGLCPSITTLQGGT